MKISLDIQIIPFGDQADLIINGRHYNMNPHKIKQPEDLNTMLCNEPEYVRVAVVGMLYEACA